MGHQQTGSLKLILFFISFKMSGMYEVVQHLL